MAILTPPRRLLCNLTSISFLPHMAILFSKESVSSVSQLLLSNATAYMLHISELYIFIKNTYNIIVKITVVISTRLQLLKPFANIATTIAEFYCIFPRSLIMIHMIISHIF